MEEVVPGAGLRHHKLVRSDFNSVLNVASSDMCSVRCKKLDLENLDKEKT